MKTLLRKEKQKMALLKKYGYDIQKSREFIFAKAALGKGKVLEIGTGRGHFTVVLAKKCFSLTSIDLDPTPQRMAREYLRKWGMQKKVCVRVMDAERLSFPRQSFTAVVSVNFMHHARRPYQCLREMVRVAASKIVIADVNKKGSAILEKVHAREGHQHEHSRTSFSAMREFLQGNGFLVKTYKGFCQTILVALRNKEVSRSVAKFVKIS